DMAMYLAKEEGRNTYRFFSRELDERAQRRLQMEVELRQAMDREELVLHFQDQVEVANGRVSGVAAQLYWNHPQQGLLSAAAFYSFAEDTGLALPLGVWVLRNACQKARTWFDQGHPPLRVAVGLSRRQVLDPTLPDQLATILEETGLPRRWLEVEVSESAFQQYPVQTAAAVENLRHIGVGIAIADFGTTFTSVGLLHQLSVSRLKIGPGLIGSLFIDHEDPTIVRTLFGIARNFNLQILAEGVRNDRQRTFLAKLGCETIQGYHLPRPVSEEHWLRFLRGLKPAGMH
ncbi:MAG TPA: EAL domain-containing protein, partial [Gammaproteobacteria bacterium]|nr:EAL domain-containing protein [Gammaproteobacteria bacterium]